MTSNVATTIFTSKGSNQRNIRTWALLLDTSKYLIFQKIHSMRFLEVDVILVDMDTLRKECPYSEFFWSVFSWVWTEYGDFRIQSKSRKIRTRKTPNTDTFDAVIVEMNDDAYIVSQKSGMSI